MIATILPGSPNFHAVGYNERKVSKGVARLIEMQNFGTLGTFGKPTPDELVKYLQEYTSRNNRIQKAQFHVAISCKGHELSESELLEFAHRYLSEMGYAEAGQPLLIYSHYDTDNTHLHIVTSRIAPDGRKIVHDHERRRSQEAIDRILRSILKKYLLALHHEVPQGGHQEIRRTTDTLRRTVQHNGSIGHAGKHRHSGL